MADPSNVDAEETFYHCVNDRELLKMHCTLIKNEKILFNREGWHWWLTGFQVGEYSEPSELTMNIDIMIDNEMMRNAFVQGLYDAGYLENEININGSNINLIFEKPRTKQPYTRTEHTDKITQQKNKLLCEYYQSITGPYLSFPEKMNAVRKQAPWLFKMVLNLGKGEQFFQIYKKVKGYLKK